LCDELLNGEIFDRLKETMVDIAPSIALKPSQVGNLHDYRPSAQRPSNETASLL